MGMKARARSRTKNLDRDVNAWQARWSRGLVEGPGVLGEIGT